jgi:4-amino-4-deoxy-L-arabinose transferase-like glycosyltransferase
LSKGWGALFFLIVIGITELFFVVYNPPFSSPDELSHLQYARFLRENGRFPDPYHEKIKVQQDKHPPYTYLLGALAIGEERVSQGEKPIRLPGPFQISLDLEKVSEGSGISNFRLFFLRGLMALHWLIGSFFLWRLARLLWPQLPNFSFGMALGFSTIPQVVRIGASFSPDSPLMAFSAISLFYLCSLLERWNTRRAWLAGLFIGLALLSKSAAICLVPLPFLLFASSLRGKPNHFGFRGLLITLGVPAILSGWWYVRNYYLFGDPFQMLAQVETYTHSVRRSPITPVFYEVFFEDLWRTFFGFDGRDSLLPHPVYYVLAGLFGIGFSGVFLLFRRSIREEVSQLQLRALSLGASGFLLLLCLTFLGNLSIHSPQGRYLFPMLGGLMVICGIGWRVSFRMKSRDFILYPALGFVVALLGMIFFHYAFLPRFYPKKARIFSRGGDVYFYEDCGTPKLHPHRIQGFDIPDGSQEGRVISWRTLDGHPSRVIYRFPVSGTQQESLQIRVTYFNPDPGTPYVAERKGHFVYPSQRLRVNGKLLHDSIEITSTPKTFVFPVPRGWVSEGRLELSFEKTQGLAATVAEIWIEKRWVSLEMANGSLSLVNESSKALDCFLSLRGDKADRLSRVVLAPGVNSFEALGLSVSSPKRVVGVCLAQMSPWAHYQAESFPFAKSRWFGALRAEGGYFIRGRRGLCRLPDGAESKGGRLLLFRVRRGGRDWKWIRESGRIDPSARISPILVSGRSIQVADGLELDLDAIQVLDLFLSNQLR